MKQLRVGQWWNKYTTKQQEHFIEIWKDGIYDVHQIRKFITSAHKAFGDSIVEIRRNLCVVTDTGFYAYSYDTNRFVKFDV